MKFITATFFAIFFSTPIFAQSIKYHDVHPDTTVNTWNDFMVFGVDIWWHPSPEVVIKSWGDWEVLCSAADTLPLALSIGDEISANSTARCWLKTTYRCLNCYGAVGHWKTPADKYLAVRNKTAGGWVYGWARLSIAVNGTAFTIKDYAIQANENTAIKAGQTIGTAAGMLSLDDETYAPSVANGIMSFPGMHGNYKLVVFDVSGRALFNGLANNRSSIDISAFPAGSYFLRFDANGSSKVTQVILR